MSSRPGSKTNRPAKSAAADRVLPAPNTPPMGRPVLPSLRANTTALRVASTCSSCNWFFLSGCCMAQRVVVRAVALLSANTKWRVAFFFAGGCLGWSRAERPSVSWTKMLETLCLQQPKEMLNIKSVQKHAKGHRYQQSPNTSKESRVSSTQRRGLRWNPKESTYARVGRCNQGRGLWWNPKEAPMPEPEVRVRDS